MKVGGSFQVNAPIEEVWQVFMDPEQLCRVMPGCEGARRIDATHYEATLATKVQFMTIRARALGELVEQREPEHLVVEMTGETLAMAGAFRARLELDLHPEAEATEVRYDFDVTMLGRLGSLGAPMVRSTARKLSEEFAGNVSAYLDQSKNEPPPNP